MRIKFVYKAQQEFQNSFSGKPRKKVLPTGQAHIFKESIDGKLQDRSLCGVSNSEIGEKVTTLSSRVQGLPICVSCSEKWKTDKSSEWNAWVSSVSNTVAMK